MKKQYIVNPNGAHVRSYHGHEPQHSFSNCPNAQNVPAHPIHMAINQMQKNSKMNTGHYHPDLVGLPHHQPAHQVFHYSKPSPHDHNASSQYNMDKAYHHYAASIQMQMHKKQQQLHQAYHLHVPHGPEKIHEKMVRDSDHFGADGHNFDNHFLHGLSFQEIQDDYSNMRYYSM